MRGKTCIIAKFHRTDLVICSYSKGGAGPCSANGRAPDS